MEEVSGRKQGGMSPCAACKPLRRRCAQDCVFAPHFPADQPHKFASVHRVFGASNVNKMLQELPEHQRSDAVSSMVYEANARVRDPVYGCVGAISSLQQQIDALQTQLAIALAEAVHLKMNQFPSASSSPAATSENTSLVLVKQIMPKCLIIIILTILTIIIILIRPPSSILQWKWYVVNLANSLWSC